MTLQKNVKSHVFLDFEKKNVKNVFSNNAAHHVGTGGDMLSFFIFLTQHSMISLRSTANGQPSLSA